ncbi:MAG: FtsW/RodA/SpoVE family cell cycle protein [Erysipelotrichaceae bacterium]
MSLVKSFFSKLFRSNKQGEKLITIAIYVLLIFSLFFITSASINSGSSIESTSKNILKQLLILIISFAVFNLFSNYFNQKSCKRIMFVILILELLLLLFAYGYCKIYGSINGNYSWISIRIAFFQFGIQPSEFAKGIIILAIACMFGDRKFKSDKSYKIVFRTFFIFFILYIFIVVFLQRDTGSGLILLIIGCSLLLFLENKRFKPLQIFLFICALCAVGVFFYCLLTESGMAFLAKISPTFAARFSAVTNPDYTSDATREIFYSLLGISRGQLFGVGIGNSVQKFGYLVSSDADYIFAVIIEEIGILGILFVFVPYIIIISLLLYYANKMSNETDRLILIGTVIYLAVHFILNVGGVSGLLPLTGVPLLLVSRGGSATFGIMAMLGICQNRIADYYIEKKNKSGFIG